MAQRKHNRPTPKTLHPMTPDESILVLEQRMDNLEKSFTTANLTVTNEFSFSKIGPGTDPSIVDWLTTCAFTAADNDTVQWSAGDLLLADGTSYSITASNTGAMAAKTFIYWDKTTSTVLNTTTTYSNALGSGKICIAIAQNVADATKYATFQVFGAGGGAGIYIGNQNLQALSVDTSELVNGAVEEAKIAALAISSGKIQDDAITASKINVIGINGTTGRIIVADLTDADMVTSGINNFASTLIGAGKILISGTTTLSNWSHGSDATYIDGGDIYTRSITASQIATGTITANEIAANTITANEIAANAITASELNAGAVTADKISVTTLAAIVADLGAITAGSIVITTGGTNKIWLNESGDGSLQIGGLTKASAPFRVTAAGAVTATSATVSGTINATGGYFGDGSTRVSIEAAGINVGNTGSIRGGQTAYDTGTGFWLGYSTAYKLSIGNSAGNKLTWDGTTMAITGTVTATLGAIGGWTVGATTLTATNIWLDSGNKKIYIGATSGTPRIEIDGTACTITHYGSLINVEIGSGQIQVGPTGGNTRLVNGGLIIDHTAGQPKITSTSDFSIVTDVGDILIDPAGGDVDFDACNIAVDAGKKINLEGVTGDTYMVFNSGAAQIDFYVNGVLCGHINAATGFVDD